MCRRPAARWSARPAARPRAGGSTTALVEDALTEAVLEVAGGATRRRRSGIAAAGFVDAAGERVLFAPHLPWRDEDVRGPPRRALGDAPVALDNDANCAARAEATLRRGARRPGRASS